MKSPYYMQSSSGGLPIVYALVCSMSSFLVCSFLLSCAGIQKSVIRAVWFSFLSELLTLEFCPFL